eukprot:499404_1
MLRTTCFMMKFSDKECWLVRQRWQLVFVTAIILSLLFHYIVLGIMCFKCHKIQSNHSFQLFKYTSIIKRLIRFVSVYTIIRVLPIIARICQFFTNSSPPLWLIMSHHICIASIGMANGIVWLINDRDETHQKSQLKQMEKEINHQQILYIPTDVDNVSYRPNDITPQDSNALQSSINTTHSLNQHVPLFH